MYLEEWRSIKYAGSLAICSSMILLSLMTESCLKRKFLDGKAGLISTTDSVLNDSAIFAGHVYSIANSFNNTFSPIADAIVWIENSDKNGKSNSSGLYQIKLLPGTYTVKCQENTNNPWPQLVEELKNVKIEKNQKIVIDFYLGTTIE